MNVLIQPGLTLPPLDEQALQQVRNAAGEGSTVLQSNCRQEMLEFAAKVDVILGDLDPELFAAAPHLRWLHATSSGVDHILFPTFCTSDVILSGEKGLVGSHLADHAMGLLLAITRRIAAAVRDGPASWQNRFEYRAQELELEGLTMGLVGFGGTGRALARRAAAFGMHLRAVDIQALQTKPGEPTVEGLDALPSVLGACDVVAICLPLSAMTRDLFDDAMFAQMKRGAILLNVTRGEIVEQQALLRALDSGRLGGAGLDVTWTEPLPVDDPLWHYPTVVMTPHTAGASQHRAGRNLARFVANLRRYRSGEPLEGVVDKQTGF